MKKYFLPIGKRQEEVVLPEERVIYDIHGNESSVCEDVVAATTEAIRNPASRIRGGRAQEIRGVRAFHGLFLSAQRPYRGILGLS